MYSLGQYGYKMAVADLRKFLISSIFGKKDVNWLENEVFHVFLKKVNHLAKGKVCVEYLFPA